MAWWTERVVPRLVDASLGNPAVDRLRERVCARLRGRVLELGFGSGLNLPHLSPAVTALDAVDPSDLAWQRSAGRRAASQVPVRRVGLDGQRLEADDAAYDAVLATFVLCTVPSATAALAEARRVLRPGGTLHVLEHGLAPETGVARWQRRLDPLQRRVAGGCHLSRDTAALLADAGFEVSLEQHYLEGTPRLGRPWAYLSHGVATPGAGQKLPRLVSPPSR